MPGATNPIFVRSPKIGFMNVITAANITKDLSTGTIPPAVFSSNTSEGSYLDHIRGKPIGTNVASVARVFLNNGGSTTGAANNTMIAEISLQVTTATDNVALPEIMLPIKMALPPRYNVHITLATAVAAGWAFQAYGGDY